MPAEITLYIEKQRVAGTENGHLFHDCRRDFDVSLSASHHSSGRRLAKSSELLLVGPARSQRILCDRFTHGGACVIPLAKREWPVALECDTGPSVNLVLHRGGSRDALGGRETKASVTADANFEVARVRLVDAVVLSIRSERGGSTDRYSTERSGLRRPRPARSISADAAVG